MIVLTDCGIKEETNSILAEIQGNDSAVVSETKEISASSGKLYDLTTLQREANRLHSFQQANSSDSSVTMKNTKQLPIPGQTPKLCPKIMGIHAVKLSLSYLVNFALQRKLFPSGSIQKTKSFQQQANQRSLCYHSNE